MNETKKTAIVIGLIILFILVIPFAMMFKSGKGNDLVSQIEELVNSKEAKVIYIGSKNCSYCTMFSPIIEKASKNNKFEYAYFDIASLTQTQYNRLAKVLGETEGIGTPHTVIAKDGKILAELQGYVEESKLLEFLVTNGIVLKDNIVVDATPLTLIDYAGYEAALNSTTPEIVVFAQTTCSHCIATKPVLEEIAKEYKIKISYFNVDKLADADYQKLLKTLPLFSEKWGTPTTVIVSNKEAKGTLTGAATKDSYIQFFKDNGIIK